MKPRTLLILTLLVVGLGAFIWFYERELPSTDERAELAKQLLAIEADRVERLEIDWDENSVELARQSDDDEDEAAEEAAAGRSTSAEWRLVRPFAARADGTAVSGLVSRLIELETERTIDDADPQETGLASPRGTVRLVTPDGERVVRIGAEVPASSNMLVAVDGRSETFVVPASIWTDLTQEPGDWREKKLFFGQRGEIERLSLARNDERILLARRGDEFWLEAPLVDRAEQSHVDSLLSTLVGLRAEEFVDDPPADLGEIGLDPPRAAVEVVLDGREAPLRFEIGRTEEAAEEEEGGGTDAPSGEPVPNEEGVTYLRTGGQLVTVEAGLDDHLSRDLAAWRSRDLAAMEVYEVDRARITDASGAVELERDGGEWLRDGEKIVYGPATDFLYELTGARAESLAEAEGLALSAPSLTVELVAEAEGDDEEAVSETLTLYPPVDGLTPASSSTRATVLLLPAGTVEAIERELGDLRAAELAEEEVLEEESGETDTEAVEALDDAS